MCIKAKTDFDLVNVDILVLLLHLLVGDFHCADRRHLPGIQPIVSFGISAPPSSIPSAYSVLQILGRHLGLLHVERLLGKLCELPLVHLLLLQHPHSPLCHGRLPNRNRNQDQ